MPSNSLALGPTSCSPPCPFALPFDGPPLTHSLPRVSDAGYCGLSRPVGSSSPVSPPLTLAPLPVTRRVYQFRLNPPPRSDAPLPPLASLVFLEFLRTSFGLDFLRPFSTPGAYLVRRAISPSNFPRIAADGQPWSRPRFCLSSPDPHGHIPPLRRTFRYFPVVGGGPPGRTVFPLTTRFPPRRDIRMLKATTAPTAVTLFPPAHERL